MVGNTECQLHVCQKDRVAVLDGNSFALPGQLERFRKISQPEVVHVKSFDQTDLIGPVANLFRKSKGSAQARADFIGISQRKHLRQP
jgi:hypothetical protein